MAGVALGDMDRHFARPGVALVALGWLWWRAWAGVDGVDAAAFCVAGVALGDMDVHFAWQAWHLVTWIVTLRGRRGTYGTGLASGGALGSGVDALDAAAFCVAGVALGDINLALCVAGVARGDMDRALLRGMRGRRGAYGTGLSLVARLGPELTSWRPGLFAWQAWHLVTWTCTLRGRRGTW